ncbi:retrovirus-related pol polyprotein from transposon TNT 1-94 [Tanacetum coccineum]
MKEQAYNMIKTKDSRTQRQSNLNKFKEARFKISPYEFEDHKLGEIVSLKYVFEYGSSKFVGNLASGGDVRSSNLCGCLSSGLPSVVGIGISSLRNENGEMLIDSIKHGPFQLKEEIIIPATKGNPEHKRPQRLEDLTSEEKLRKSCDNKATNIILLSLLVDIYTLDQVSLKGLEQVIEQGPWLIRSTPLILNKWTPNIVLNKDEVTKVSVWLDMCGPMGEIRVFSCLIKVSADKALKHEVVMAVSKEDGDQNADTIEVAEASGDNNDFFDAQEPIKDGAESEVEDLNIDSSTKQARKGASTPSSLGINV